MKEGAPGSNNNRREVPLHIHNKAQFELAKRYFGFEPNDEQMLGWVSEHARAFRRAVDSNPEALEHYAQNPEIGLNELEQTLHEIEEEK